MGPQEKTLKKSNEAVKGEDTNKSEEK